MDAAEGEGVLAALAKAREHLLSKLGKLTDERAKIAGQRPEEQGAEGIVEEGGF
jgi:hypothetical protein